VARREDGEPVNDSEPPPRFYLEMAVWMVVGFLVFGGLTALIKLLLGHV
jgi:hypothetical protein